MRFVFAVFPMLQVLERIQRILKDSPMCSVVYGELHCLLNVRMQMLQIFGILWCK